MPVKVTYRGKPLLKGVIEGRRTLNQAINEEYAPNDSLMGAIGDEIIEGFKGGRGFFMENIHFLGNGRIVGQKGKQYPYGIRQEKSPDGEPYADLKEVTKQLKRKNDSHYVNSILQDKGGTDPNSLINSLEYRITYSPSKSTDVSGGVQVYFARNNEKSVKLEEGGNFISEDLAHPTIRYVPPRPHRGVQGEVGIRIRALLRKWAAKNR